jgi:hypothetical protein
MLICLSMAIHCLHAVQIHNIGDILYRCEHAQKYKPINKIN